MGKGATMRGMEGKVGKGSDNEGNGVKSWERERQLGEWSKKLGKGATMRGME